MRVCRVCYGLSGNSVQYRSENGKVREVNFDRVFRADSKQSDVYESIGVPALEGVLQGKSACICAYGPTGTGKTYTMTGTSSDVGLIPRVLHSLFDRLTSLSSRCEFSVTAQFIEIYNENINDLLASTNATATATAPASLLRPTVSGMTGKVDHAASPQLRSAEEALHYLEVGSLRRTIGSTNMNAVSSRSHSLFTLECTIKHSQQTDNTNLHRKKITTKSKLVLVDLAGSEVKLDTPWQKYIHFYSGSMSLSAIAILTPCVSISLFIWCRSCNVVVCLVVDVSCAGSICPSRLGVQVQAERA